MGEMAARKLIQMIESKNDRKKIESEIVSLAPSLVIRDSCGATKSGSAHSAK
jgi:DNA-binding LacI/PurR family transcriptional regulator